MNNVVDKEERFIISKIGLVNFWLYDEEEFDFYDGRLILRGSNASGKSVTMQSFIPLILDGNKNPERLDPFGGKDRKIEDYLIGEADSNQKEESTGYLYMELFKKSTNQYLTIGIGLKAKKGKGVDFWGFAIKNNQRVNRDIYLYKDKNNKVPLSKLELRSRIGEENEFVQNAKEYKAMINRLLFGFDNLDTYDEFIKLLLQLRSNKLSKDFKPTMLTKILNTVLQPLSEEDLRPLSESIEDMNKTSEQLEILQKDVKSLNELLKVYSSYNASTLFYRSKDYLDKYKELDKISKDTKKLTIELEKMNLELNEKTVDMDNKTKELEFIRTKKQQFASSDITNKVEELNDLKRVMAQNKEKIDSITEQIDKTNMKLLEKQKELTANEEIIYKLEKNIKEIIIDIDEEVADNHFTELSLFTEDLLENITNNLSFVAVHDSLLKYSNKIDKIKKQLDMRSQKESELNEYSRDYDHLKEVCNELENKLKNTDETLKMTILNWEEEFINIEANNKILKVADVAKKMIYNYINNYSNTNYREAKEVYQREYNQYLAKIKEEFYHLENKKRLNDEDILNLEKQVVTLKKQTDLEIVYDNDEVEAVNYLIENKIPFKPFYKLIEYKSNLSDEIKNYLEAILLDTKILGAKVVEEQFKEQVINGNKKGLFIFPTNKKENSLINYFEPVNDDLFSKEYINSILSSISLDKKDQFNLNCNGVYNIDFILGTTTNKYTQKYIGYLKRQEEKTKQLAILENKINDLKKVKQEITDLLNKNLLNEEVLNNESLKFPNKDSIDNILEEKEIIVQSLDWNNNKEKEIESSISSLHSILIEINKELSSLAININIPLNDLKYAEVISSLKTTTILLNELDKVHNNYLTKLEIGNSLNNITNEIETNMLTLKEKNIDLETDNLRKNNKIESIEQLLNKEENKNIQAELIEIEKKLSELPVARENLIISISYLKNEISHRTDEISKKLEILTKYRKELEVLAYIFKKEYELKYVYSDDIFDVYDCADMVFNKLNHCQSHQISEMLDQFYKTYNHYKLELNTYNLIDNTLFDPSDDDFKLFPEMEINELKTLLTNAVRKDIIGFFDGKKLNIIELSHKLDNAIKDNKDLITEQDRHLFEDILLDTVGGKIRTKITASSMWVKKINDIMKEMQQFSSLGLGLCWNGKSALSEEEIDTSKIVELLKMVPKLIKPSDANLLTNHFRSKIKKALEMNEGNYISYYNIISEVLDYRNWFDFQLLFQKTGDAKKELTDKAYSKFSGGERAKATYIPLFASVFAKYNGAKKDALRIIALDEAFAGVDEVNIREMFGILTKLELDFIVNSQTLWGDYDTIPMLSICELIKPVGSKTVSVERYKWNGKVKEIVNEVNDDVCELF